MIRREEKRTPRLYVHCAMHILCMNVLVLSLGQLWYYSENFSVISRSQTRIICIQFNIISQITIFFLCNMLYNQAFAWHSIYFCIEVTTKIPPCRSKFFCTASLQTISFLRNNKHPLWQHLIVSAWNVYNNFSGSWLCVENLRRAKQPLWGFT